jgi:hypothetical protein
MWEELTLPLDFGTIEVTTTEKEENATIHHTSH